MFPTVKINVDQQLFGYPPSSKYPLTDVNVCGAVQYIEGGESAVHSIPPLTIPAGPRLELATFGLRVRLSNH